MSEDEKCEALSTHGEENDEEELNCLAFMMGEVERNKNNIFETE